MKQSVPNEVKGVCVGNTDAITDIGVIQRRMKHQGLRLLKNTPIWLQYYSLPREEAIAFRPYFAEAWGMIPLYARRMLLNHWRQGSSAVIVSPGIELGVLSARAGPKA